MMHRRAFCTYFSLSVLMLSVSCSSGGNDAPTSATAQIAPTSYAAYSGTDPKPSPNPPPALGPANSILIDPTFNSRILRVTDSHTSGGHSLIPEMAGTLRSWNANATAFKLMTTNGASYWMDFNPDAFQAGALHPLSFNGQWEWSSVDANALYYLNGSHLSRYDTSTGTSTPIGGTPNGESVQFHAVVVGRDNWVCSVSGPGSQDSYTKLFCVNPSNGEIKYIDTVNKTINGVAQHDPNWPTSAAGRTLGIHNIFGGAVGSYLAVCFHQASWSSNGMAVLNLDTNTWSKANGNPYASGHPSIGDGRYVNGSGSVNGADSRGAILRDPSDLMNTAKFEFIMQPYSTSGWYDAEHSSWFNASTNSNAPVLFSRYDITSPPKPLPWLGEILLAATDGSNTVWRFAHNHNGGSGFYGQAFAQISNDGHWALFSSYWGGTLGSSGGDFGLSTRLDTFIVELR